VAISGKVLVSSEKVTKPLDLGQFLYPGDKVEIPANATITINYHQSGEVESWPGGLKFTVGTIRTSPADPRVKRQHSPIHVPGSNPNTPGIGGSVMIKESERLGGGIMKKKEQGDRLGGGIMKEVIEKEETPIDPIEKKEAPVDPEEMKERSVDSPTAP
jgi:hypothetical protein